VATSQIAYTTIYNNLKGSGATIIQRIAGALVDYVLNTVATEGSAVTGHAARVTLATSVMTNSEALALEFALPVGLYCGDNNIPAPTDAQLLTAVGSVWNAMCGNI
jgi:hypothetical protein